MCDKRKGKFYIKNALAELDSQLMREVKSVTHLLDGILSGQAQG